MKIGILGGGQLGRMLALAGIPMGFTFRFLDPDPHAPAGEVGELITGSYDDSEMLARFTDGIDFATFEFENVPADCVREMGRRLPIFPGANALESLQDRVVEKELFQSLGIPTAPFVPVSTANDLTAEIQAVGGRAVVKTRRFGYDGKGQWLVRSEHDCAAIANEAPRDPNSLIAEGFVDFDRELSIIAVRSLSREMAFYPLVENVHKGGILRSTVSPAPDRNAELQNTAERYARLIANRLDYTGVLTVELFQRGQGLIANEVAPRVHNSGHWTIEGAETSQFENHVRAITGMPIGSTAVRGFSAMWNILGFPPNPAEILAVPGAHLHLYGKSGRPGRKIGHVTVCGDDLADVKRALQTVSRAAPQE